MTALSASRPIDLDLVFGALADATRRGILSRLARGAATVNELVAPSGLSQPTVSQHLKVLEVAGLVTRGREARYRPVALNAKTLELLRVEAGDALEDNALPPPLQVQKVTLNGAELAFRYQEENGTALEVLLPQTVAQGQLVTIEIAFDFRLPQPLGITAQMLCSRVTAP